MDLTRTLREEHQVILRVLACFETALKAPQPSARSIAETFAPFIEFFRGFADACHHQKEEGYLFPALERAGLPHEGGPIGCMLEEHDRGRAHVKAIAAAIELTGNAGAGALDTVVTEGEAYIELLRDHIHKEDNVLFEMADEIIVGDDAARLAEQFSVLGSDIEYTERSTKGRTIADRLMVDYADTIEASVVR